MYIKIIILVYKKQAIYNIDFLLKSPYTLK